MINLDIEVHIWSIFEKYFLLSHEYNVYFSITQDNGIPDAPSS